MTLTRKAPRRLWGDAIAKIHREQFCRLCGRTEHLEAAHTVGRKYQDEKRVGPRGGVSLWVNPDSVIGLCSMCHRLQHQKKVSVLRVLTWAELSNAARACRMWGLDCRRQLTGRRSDR